MNARIINNYFSDGIIVKNSENLMEKQYKTTNGFTNATNLKLFVAYRIAIIKSQDLGKTKNEKRLRFYENNWQ